MVACIRHFGDASAGLAKFKAWPESDCGAHGAPLPPCRKDVSVVGERKLWQVSRGEPADLGNVIMRSGFTFDHDGWIYNENHRLSRMRNHGEDGPKGDSQANFFGNLPNGGIFHHFTTIDEPGGDGPLARFPCAFGTQTKEHLVVALDNDGNGELGVQKRDCPACNAHGSLVPVNLTWFGWCATALTMH